MKLRLTLFSSPPAQGADVQRHLSAGRLTIGRGPDNDWVLRDEERVLSKNHCVVEFKGGAFVVIDCSSNGVFVNESDAPIGRGGAAILADGDRLRFGAFAMRAQFVADDPPPESADPFLAVLRSTDQPAADFADDPFPPDPFPRAAGPVAFSAIPADDDDGFLLPPRPKLGPIAAEAAWRRDNPEWNPAADRDHVAGHEQAWRSPTPAAGGIPDDWEEDPIDCSSPPCFAGAFPEPAAPSQQSAAVVARGAGGGVPDDWEQAPSSAFPPPTAGTAKFSDDDGGAGEALARLVRQARAAARALDADLAVSGASADPFADRSDARQSDADAAEAAVAAHMRALLAAARRVMADAGLPIENLEAAYRRALEEGTPL